MVKDKEKDIVLDEEKVETPEVKESVKVKNDKPKQIKHYSVPKGQSFEDIEKLFKLEKGSLAKLNPQVDLTNAPNGKMIQIEG